MLKNMFRHFFVAFGAILYLGSCPLLLYQYLGVMRGWPGVFLSVVHDTSGDWWLDIDWASPTVWGMLGFTLLAAAGYAVLKRGDLGGYREAEVHSQPGF